MRPPTYWWFARFAQLAIVFSMAFGILAGLSLALCVPSVVWLATDQWHWTPLTRWLRYVVLGASGGIMVGASMTAYEWMVQTPATLLRKATTMGLVVSVCILLTAVLREYVGRLLPG